MKYLAIVFALLLCQTEVHLIDDYIKWAESKRDAYNMPETDMIKRHEAKIRTYTNELRTTPKNRKLSYTDQEFRNKIAREQSEIDVLWEKIGEKNKKPYLPPPSDKPKMGRYTTIKGRVLKANENGHALIELPSKQVVAIRRLPGLIDGETLKGEPFVHLNSELEVNGRKVLAGYYLDKTEVMKAYQSYMDKKHGK